MIHTDRLILRPLEMSDLDELIAYQSKAQVVKYIPWPERTPEQVIEAIEKSFSLTGLANEGDYYVLGFALKDTNKIIGQLNACLESAANKTASIGWVLNPQFSGEGYATEAVRAWIDHIFATYDFHRLTAKIDQRNIGSADLAKRVGMRKEGEFREDDFFKGEWTSTWQYALLRSELS